MPSANRTFGPNEPDEDDSGDGGSVGGEEGTRNQLTMAAPAVSATEATVSRRPAKQRDYHLVPPNCPLVIDNGAFHCRIGWAGEANPRFEFRNVVNKPRHRASGEVVSVIGDFDPTLVKTFDFTRAAVRTPFDGNVVYQFETMESILDYAFERMGIEGSQVDHPVLITECPCNPSYCRSKMAELLFEAYGVPSVAFGIDGVFSYLYNHSRGHCEADGLLICAGHMATHVIPIFGGEPVLESAVRTPVGGYHVTDFFKRYLSLHYPQHMASLSWDKVEELKQEYCYIADDYLSELEVFQKGGHEADEKTFWWQLPWVPPPPEKEPVTEEELARKAAIKEKQGQRLRDMAAAKRSSKIADLETEIQGLEQLLQNLDGAENDESFDSILAESGFLSREEIQSTLSKAIIALRKAKGEVVQPEKEKVEDTAEKYPLLDIPNSLLTAEQLKEKKRQKFLKMTSEGRARAKLKRQEEGALKERVQQMDEERRLENPEQYLEELRTRYSDLTARADQRKRKRRKSGSVSSLTGGAPGSLVLGGRGERLTAAQKERMRLLATAAFDGGKEEDTFGMRDEDWQLYKRMGKDGEEDEDAEEDDAELVRLEERLKEIDPSFVPTASTTQASEAASTDTQKHPLTAKDFRIPLGVERIRCPEILMQPTMVGVDQVGVREMVGASLRRLPEDYYEPVVQGTIFLTGGSSLFKGLDLRLTAELRSERPYGSFISAVRASDPLLDAWRGASFFAASEAFSKSVISKEDYDEKGQEWLRKYKLQYSLSLP